MSSKPMKATDEAKNPKKPTDFSNRSGAQTPTYRRPTPPPPPKKK